MAHACLQAMHTSSRTLWPFAIQPRRTIWPEPQEGQVSAAVCRIMVVISAGSGPRKGASGQANPMG
jgi:hypothetical protein